MIYLDNGATSLPKPKCVIDAMSWAAAHMASPSRGSSKASEQADELLYTLRMEAGRLFGCQSQNVVFTGSATHGLNIAIKSLAERGDRVVISGMEHNAVVRPLYAIGADVQIARGMLFDNARILEDFDRLLTPATKLCVLTHVSNVFGWILPVQEIAKICRDRHIPLIVDASQSAGTLEISMDELGASFIAMPGHKGLQGPQGTGLLLCNGPVKTLIEGGTGSLSRDPAMPDFLPDRLEAGTPNISGAAGLLAGIRWVEQAGITNIRNREEQLRGVLSARLSRIPGVQVYQGNGQTGTLSIRVQNQDCVILASRLGRNGYALRAGLHCAPLAHETAGTLPNGTLRVSLGPMNTISDVQKFTITFNAILQEEKL